MFTWRSELENGLVIPACPLALWADGTWSESHQRALLRYYVAAGAGGLAIGVHTTQFLIRDPKYGLYQPLLRFVADVLNEESNSSGFVRVAGICGRTSQALSEAETARELGYHCGLLSLSAWKDADDAALVAHCRDVSEVLPVFGFYLQPAVGGRKLSYQFWRSFCEIPNVVAIKIAAFNRYQTWDVIRAVIESGREDIALYTGNDDNIIADLLTPFRYRETTRRIVGGLLGQWAVWTKSAVEMLNRIRVARGCSEMSASWMTLNAELTDANAAVFDAAHEFAGCIPGINEILRRSGLLPSARCLDPNELLSPGQDEELTRVCTAYPYLTDDAFVHRHLSEWLAP